MKKTLLLQLLSLSLVGVLTACSNTPAHIERQPIYGAERVTVYAVRAHQDAPSLVQSKAPSVSFVLWGVQDGAPLPPTNLITQMPPISWRLPPLPPPVSFLRPIPQSAPPPEPLPAVVAPSSPSPMTTEIDVTFAVDSSELSPAAKSQLETLITSGMRIADIVGHTDNKGRDDYNELLGLRRASAVKAFVDSISPSADPTMAIASKGSAQPRETNTTVSGRALNRRAAINAQLPPEPQSPTNKGNP